jgi:hypothetical protein
MPLEAPRKAAGGLFGLLTEPPRNPETPSTSLLDARHGLNGKKLPVMEEEGGELDGEADSTGEV